MSGLFLCYHVFTIGNVANTKRKFVFMPKPNTQFDLSVDDLDLIETALRQHKAGIVKDCAGTSDDARNVHELLGRLHNQKVFYRPKDAYIGG